MIRNKEFDKKVGQMLDDMQKIEEYVTEVNCVSNYNFILFLSKVDSLIFNIEESVIFGYPQSRSNQHDGSSFYDVEHYCLIEYYLCIKDEFDYIKIAKFLEIEGKKCLVANPNYLDFIKEYSDKINAEISRRLNEYNIDASIDLSQYKIISIEEIPVNDEKPLDELFPGETREITSDELVF